VPPAAVRAWRVVSCPGTFRWLALALLVAVAAAAGSLMILSAEHDDLAGLAASALLGLMALTGTAFFPRQPAGAREQDTAREPVTPELAAVPGWLAAPHQGAAVPGLDDVYPD